MVTGSSKNGDLALICDNCGQPWVMIDLTIPEALEVARSGDWVVDQFGSIVHATCNECRKRNINGEAHESKTGTD